MSAGSRALALAAALLLPAAAAAGPAVSLRAGWAPSFGEVGGGVPTDEVVRSQLPVQVDALWRFGPLAAGGYASFGFGVAGCDRDARCTATSVRVGAQATWTFRLPGRSLAPWAGAGVGYEWTTRRRERAGTEVAWAYRGPELASLQGGADFSIDRHVTVGPFLLLTFGSYSTLSVDTPVESSSAEIAAKGVHTWLEIGVRGTYDF